MESSEDDAGAATNASRRVSAREKDVGQIEDVNATSSFQQDPSEQRTSCETPAMSEDNFDGDSVPSPSTQDVNTSTEAILDMIDEIVDGPGAPKRLPFALENDTDSRFAGGGDSNTNVDNTVNDENSLKLSHSAPATSAKINEEQSLPTNSSNILTTQNAVLADDKEDCVQLPENSSSALNSDRKVVSIDTQKETVSCSEEPQDSISVPIIPSSSVLQTVQSVSETESALCERTVKCVTSSDNRDNVVVESAESTSSDNSISDTRIPVESATRSPLRRRLVRPLPNRPDSTVSSTVDSSVNIDTSEQASESIVKDVSSSSDAVPIVHGNVKPEEIRNISEVSICKAETSSPSKKIKLIRQKIVPQTCQTQTDHNVDGDPLTAQIDQCQSTSEAINIALNSCAEPVLENKASNLENQCDTEPNIIPSKSPDRTKDVIPESTNETSSKKEDVFETCSSIITNVTVENSEQGVFKKKSPLNINLSTANTSETIESTSQHIERDNVDIATTNSEESDVTKQVPKLTIKLGNVNAEEIRPPVPKLTIKPLRPPSEVESQPDKNVKEQIPHVKKLNIKPITQPEKINEIHRKSSSSEISESEYSENDESASTSDQASASDQGSSDIVPKVTIKLGKPGTESEGQFYTEKNVPKLTIKVIQNNDIQEQPSPSKLKVVLSQPEDAQVDKVPKLTIKTVAKCESQPLSPKLIIKPLKPPDDLNKENASDHCQISDIAKFKTSAESSSNAENKETHVPKITIKPVTKSYDSPDNIPVVTKLNIKPLIKPDNIDLSEGSEEKVPVVSKLNIKPIVKPKDSEIDSSKEDVPKITKLNIKPLKSPETNSSEEKDCDVKADVDENSIPVVTKLNIKPIVKPLDEDMLRDNENQSSETGNSSDDNADQIPIVTKINIKPICKPNYVEESGPSNKKEDNIPVVTKLNIKPLIKPDESISPQSPKKEISKMTTSNIPTVTKLNIKPILKPDEIKHKDISEEDDEISAKNPPLVMKINRKTIVNEDQYSIDKNDHEHCNNVNDPMIPVVSKVNIKPIVRIPEKNLIEELNDDLKKPDAISKASLKHVEMNDNKTNNLGSDQNCVNDLSLPCVKGDVIASVKENACDMSIVTAEKSQESKNIPLHGLSSSPQHKISKSILENQASQVTVHNDNVEPDSESNITLKISTERLKVKSTPVRQNCTLLKKLLENRKDKGSEVEVGNKMNATKYSSSIVNDPPKSPTQNVSIGSDLLKERLNLETKSDSVESNQIKESKANIIGCNIPLKVRSIQELCKEANEHLTKPLEINISDKVSCHSPDQDSPRIILKINKTDQGASAKIITEEIKKPDGQSYSPKNTHDLMNDTHQKKNLLNSRRKPHVDTPMPMGKRLRSSRILQTSDKQSPTARRNMGKRASTSEPESPPQNKEPELSVLETKRLKLGQLLSNKSLTITPIAAKAPSLSPPVNPLEIRQSGRNHSLLNNENCAKNGSSKLHNILSNLQAKQLHALDLIHPENNQSSSPDLKSSTSVESQELISDNTSMDKSRPEVQMIFHDNSESRDFSAPEEMARDPLEDDSLRSNDFIQDIPKPVDMTPQPKKRGRPRKLPVSEGAKTVVTLPVPALEERPQRSLRLSRYFLIKIYTTNNYLA